jgi:putative peptidoglycan lipid II flippase
MVSNMFFNAIFAYFFSYVGLAMATALSALINAGLLYRGLHIANVYRITKKTLFFVLRLVIAGVAMVASLLWLMPNIDLWSEWSTLNRATWLGGLIAVGAFVYLISVMILGIRPHHLRTDS